MALTSEEALKRSDMVDTSLATMSFLLKRYVLARLRLLLASAFVCQIHHQLCGFVIAIRSLVFMA